MPCDTVQTNTISVPRMQPALRARALATIGAQVRGSYFTLDGHAYQFSEGELTSTTASDADLARVAALVKRAYSAQVVKYTAARNGWQVREVAPFQYEVLK